MKERLRALRGATTVERDDAEAIVEATAELLEAMMSHNGAAHEDLVSVIFTTTKDLSAEFPAAAARRLGISTVPLLCATEIDVPGAVERCVRVLMHLHTDRNHELLRHVYLRGAQHLRADL
ncbi:MAG: chorismate mutase [Actinomycetota bacterium]|nr:chorismate mutase [Actinomycetota bacterium]